MDECLDMNRYNAILYCGGRTYRVVGDRPTHLAISFRFFGVHCAHRVTSLPCHAVLPGTLPPAVAELESLKVKLLDGNLLD